MRISQTVYGTNSLIPKKVIDNIVLFFLFIYISNTASICFEQTFSFVLIGLFCTFFLLKKRRDRSVYCGDRHILVLYQFLIF